MKNNKKGFTLIELLAVIVVLAIIMVIATGQVTKTINDARKNSFTSSYKMIIKEIKNRIVESDMDMTSREVVCYKSGDQTLTVANCLSSYDLSVDDYELKVEDASSAYKVTLTGKANGKFANVDYDNANNGTPNVPTDDVTGDCPVSNACTDGTDGSDNNVNTKKLNTIVVYVNKTTGAVSATN